MSRKRVDLLAGQAAQQKTLAAARVASGKQTTISTGKRTGLTLRLDNNQYERLREAAFHRKVKLHDLMVEGLEMVLAKYKH